MYGMNATSARCNGKELARLSQLPFSCNRTAIRAYVAPRVQSETALSGKFVHRTGDGNAIDGSRIEVGEDVQSARPEKGGVEEWQRIPDGVLSSDPRRISGADGRKRKCFKKTGDEFFYFVLSQTLKKCKSRLDEIRRQREHFCGLFRCPVDSKASSPAGQLRELGGSNARLATKQHIDHGTDVSRETGDELIQIAHTFEPADDYVKGFDSVRTMSSPDDSSEGDHDDSSKTSFRTSVSADTAFQEVRELGTMDTPEQKVSQPIRAHDLLTCYNNDKYGEELLYTLVDDFCEISRDSVQDEQSKPKETGNDGSSAEPSGTTNNEDDIMSKSMEDSFEEFLQINGLSIETNEDIDKVSTQIMDDSSAAQNNSLSVLNTGHNKEVEWSWHIEESLDTLLQTISAPFDTPEDMKHKELPQITEFSDTASKELVTSSVRHKDSCGGCPSPGKRHRAGNVGFSDDATALDNLETHQVFKSPADTTGNRGCSLSMVNVQIDDVRFPPSGDSDTESFRARDEISENQSNARDQIFENQSDKGGNSCDTGPQQSKWWSEEEDRRDICFIRVPSIPAQQIIFHVNQNGAVKIGEGSFGTVFLADLFMRGALHQVVIKDFSPKGVTKPREIIEEAKILMHLSDTTFIPYFHGLLMVASPQRFALVQEFFARGMNLHHIIEENSIQLSQVSWISICVQLAVGLDRFHRKAILMNDIKKDNILVDCRTQECILKYVDMGLASYKCGRVFYGSKEYLEQFTHLAPEVRRFKRTTTASDVYSTGMILKSIANAAPLDSVNDIARMCLHKCPTTRPNIRGVVCKLLAVKDCIYRSQPLPVLITNNSLKRWCS